MNTENHYQETDLGNISLNPRGEYNPEESYEYLDLVVLEGGSYVCLAENGATITGISPESGKTTQYWQVITIPGSLTPEYIAMHDRVVNLSEQVEADAEEVRTAEQNVSGMELNVTQMQEQTRQSAEAAEQSKDSSAGYAASADASRQAAEESKQNIDAQVTGFDSHVAEKTEEAENDIEAARIAANKAIIAQQEQSVNEVARAGIEAISTAQSAAQTATEKAQAADTSEKNAAESETAAKLSEANATKMAEQVAADKEQVAYDRTAVENAKQEITESSAQIEKNTQGISELKVEINGDEYTKDLNGSSVEWVNGTWDNGILKDSNWRVRPKTYINIRGCKSLSVSISAGYKFFIVVTDANMSTLNNTQWLQSDLINFDVPDNAEYLMYVVSNSSDSQASVSFREKITVIGQFSIGSASIKNNIKEISKSVAQMEETVEEVTEVTNKVKDTLSAEVKLTWHIGGLGSSAEVYVSRKTDIYCDYIDKSTADEIEIDPSLSVDVCLYDSMNNNGVRYRQYTKNSFSVSEIMALRPTANYVRIAVYDKTSPTEQTSTTVYASLVHAKKLASISEFSEEINNIQELVDTVEREFNAGSKTINKVGTEAGVLYPCYIPPNTKVAISTSNGEPMTRTVRLYSYDENRKELAYFSYLQGDASRITTTGTNTIYYIGWKEEYDIPLQFEVSPVVHNYVPYEQSFAQKINEELEEIRSGVKGRFDTYDALIDQCRFTISANNRVLTLMHFSDVHNDLPSMEMAMEVAEYFNDKIDDVIHTGDVVRENFDDGIVNWVNSGCASKFLSVIGNHDTEINLVLAAEDKKNVYNAFLAPYIANWGVTQPTGASANGFCYYYKDYTAQKIRLIVIDGNYWDSAQHTWFTNTISDAKAKGYAVVLASHECGTKTTGVKGIESNWTSYLHPDSTTSPYTNLTDEILTTIDNFIANGGDFIIWIGGHTHYDRIGYIKGHENILTYAIDKASIARCVDGARISGSDSANCYNIMSVDASDKVIKFVRIGFCVDGRMRPKNVFCYDYANKKIVSEW